MAAGDVERKVALLLEHGVRKTRRAAEMFVAHRDLQRFDVADYQHRIELLRMYGCALDAVYAESFQERVDDQAVTIARIPRASQVRSNSASAWLREPVAVLFFSEAVSCLRTPKMKDCFEFPVTSCFGASLDCT